MLAETDVDLAYPINSDARGLMLKRLNQNELINAEQWSSKIAHDQNGKLYAETLDAD